MQKTGILGKVFIYIATLQVFIITFILKVIFTFVNIYCMKSLHMWYMLQYEDGLLKNKHCEFKLPGVIILLKPTAVLVQYGVNNIMNEEMFSQGHLLSELSALNGHFKKGISHYRVSFINVTNSHVYHCHRNIYILRGNAYHFWHCKQIIW